MSLVLRRIFWPGDKRPPDKPDYHVMDGDQEVGRIYHADYPGGAKWFWSINGLAIRGAQIPGGVADTLQDAQAKFRAAWDGTDKR